MGGLWRKKEVISPPPSGVLEGAVSCVGLVPLALSESGLVILGGGNVIKVREQIFCESFDLEPRGELITTSGKFQRTSRFELSRS